MRPMLFKQNQENISTQIIIKKISKNIIKDNSAVG